MPGDGAVVGGAGVAHPAPVQCRIREVAIELDGALDVLARVLAVDAVGGQVLAVPLRPLQASAQQRLVHMLVLAPAREYRKRDSDLDLGAFGILSGLIFATFDVPLAAKVSSMTVLFPNSAARSSPLVANR